ncbi:RNA-directed DNA polymerase [Nocardioides sp. R1-1]|uniref:RNA-directed DNA polymerase n=1 Tax=Nocardioides sp. R1-1 TaxID=3383502 RepID=UPI0038D2078F
MMMVQSPASLVDDLHEDLRTRWVPDVIADADAGASAVSPSLDADALSLFPVLRDAGPRVAPIFTVQALAAQRQAVASLRLISDGLLEPTVCGYRRGADGDSDYSTEYQRFRSLTESMLDCYPLVVTADVSDFFDSVDLEQVRGSMSATMGEECWAPIEGYLRQLHGAGVPGLPAGYGDARLIANAVLTPVDRRIESEWVRWVDDYRIFVRSEAEAFLQLDRLRRSLRSVGLRLNESKVRVTPSDHFRKTMHGGALTSVYHPETESGPTVRAALRSVFIDAVNTENRRLLRFALPRLAEQGDDFAVAYAVDALQSRTLDAPRLVGYLSTFIDDKRVTSELGGLVACAANDPWRLARLVPLMCGARLDSETDAQVETLARSTRVPALWGLLLRVLSLQERTPAVVSLLESPGAVLDARAALAACADLGRQAPSFILDRAPQTAEALRNGSVAKPSADTLL